MAIYTNAPDWITAGAYIIDTWDYGPDRSACQMEHAACRIAEVETYVGLGPIPRVVSLALQYVCHDPNRPDRHSIEGMMLNRWRPAAPEEIEDYQTHQRVHEPYFAALRRHVDLGRVANGDTVECAYVTFKAIPYITK